MRNKITQNIIGAIPIETIRGYVPEFTPNDYDVDKVVAKILEEGGVSILMEEARNHYEQLDLKEEQKKSLDYFLGNNDSKINDDENLAFFKNPLTGMLFEQDADRLYAKKIALPLHKQVVDELKSYTKGSEEIIINFNDEANISDEAKKVLNSFTTEWNNSEEIFDTVIEDFLIYGFSGIRWVPRLTKNFLGESEWKLVGDRIEPINTSFITLGRIENKLNDADVICNWTYNVDDTHRVIKLELTTNKAIYVLNSSTKIETKKEEITTYTHARYPIWIKETEEVDFITPPFSFMEMEKYGKMIFGDYKTIIDCLDDLLNSSVANSIEFDETLLFIKSGGMSKETLTDLEEDLKKYRDGKEAGRKNTIIADNPDSSIESIKSELPTAFSEMTFKLLWEAFYSSSSTINYNEVETNTNYNAIKKKYNKLLNKITPIRRRVKTFITNSIETLIVFESKKDKKIAKELSENKNNAKIEFNNSFLVNELDQANAIATAVGGGFLSKRTASEISGLSATDEFARLAIEKKEAEEKLEKEAQQTLESQKEIANNSQGNREGGISPGDLRQKSVEQKV